MYKTWRHKTIGGFDDVSNMKPLDLSVNRSLGVQIQNAIKGYPN